MRDIFQKLIAARQLAHGYLFFGQKNPEKFIFAHSLANYLETGRWQPPAKTLIDAAVALTGGIDDVRQLRQFLWQKPFASPRRTAIIKNGQGLTVEAQNAILKIAEEPPPHGLLILIAEQPEALLPTVVSRFQKIYFPYNPKPHTSIPKTYNLKEALADDQLLEEYVTAKMSELAQDPVKNYQALKELLKRWTYIKQSNVNKKLQLEAFLSKMNSG